MPTHLGQACVCFTHACDRDNMVRHSPMPFGNIQISFANHNEGRNWRRVLFTVDCWMMLLRFPDDYKSEFHIQNTISEFGKVILWEESEHFPGRIMVRARVTSIEDVPQFLVYADSLDLNGKSWTIQCEVMQHHNWDRSRQRRIWCLMN